MLIIVVFKNFIFCRKLKEKQIKNIEKYQKKQNCRKNIIFLQLNLKFSTFEKGV